MSQFSTAATGNNEFVPCISFLNAHGDITIAWEEEDGDKVRKLVEQKMKEGYVFFIVREPGRRGADPKLKSVAEFGKATQNKLRVTATADNIKIDDAALEAALKAGFIKVSRNSEKGKAVETTRRATSATEVAVAQSVAVKPVKGG